MVTIDAFSCPKEGNEESDYEDAWSYKERPEGPRVAIADGATESSFSQLWARLLVQSYTRSPRPHGTEFFKKLEAPRRVWHRHVKTKDLPWYAKEKAGLGAFAAFIGVKVDTTESSWEAIAVGDCCLFHLDLSRHGMRLLQAFPLTQSADFGMSPFLLGTSRERSEEVEPHIRLSSGFLRPGDSLFLASDALAAWMLMREEIGKSIWEMMGSINSQSKFGAFVRLARKRGLHNDDTTLVKVTLNG